MAHAKVGRPPKYNDDQIAEMVSDFEDYIDTHNDPIIVGFTSSYKKYFITRDYINDREEFSTLKKRAIEKSEAYLMSDTKDAPAMRIFRLKQRTHGFTDRTESDITTGGDKLNIALVSYQKPSNDATDTP